MSRVQLQGSDPITVIDEFWRGQATENAADTRDRDPGDRTLHAAVHSYVTGRFPASWLLDEGEVLTFEH